MNTETVTVQPKGDGFEIIVQHDQTGSAYGINLSKEAYEQLRLHFVVATEGKLCGSFEPDNRTSSATICKHCGREKFMHPHN